jgi:tellurite resistance protein
MSIFGLIFVGFYIISAVFDFINKNKDTDNKNPSLVGPSDEEIISSISSTMTVGVYCALGDGNLDNRELETLRKWKMNFISNINDRIKSKLDTAMELDINSSLSGVSEQRLHTACSKIKIIGDPFKTMTLGLAFEIVAADQKIEPSEMECLHKIARLLDISDIKFKDLEEKHLRPIQLKDATSGQSNDTANEQLLGINSSWTKDQKLAKLTSEFSKYNARMQTIRNDEHRAQCRRMLEIIAAMREELTTGRKPVILNQTSSPTRSGPVIPPPVASKDERLIGINPLQSPRDKITTLNIEQVRWESRLKNNLSPEAFAKCEEALQAIRRLRNLYMTQI